MPGPLRQIGGYCPGAFVCGDVGARHLIDPIVLRAVSRSQAVDRKWAGPEFGRTVFRRRHPQISTDEPSDPESRAENAMDITGLGYTVGDIFTVPKEYSVVEHTRGDVIAVEVLSCLARRAGVPGSRRDDEWEEDPEKYREETDVA